MFYNSNIIFRILILFLESKFSFSAYTSSFYVMTYNSKTWIGILNTDLDEKWKVIVLLIASEKKHTMSNEHSFLKSSNK